MSHPAFLSGVHLRVLKKAPCRAVWIKRCIDFPTSSSSGLLSQSANENKPLNQTFCSFSSQVWISEIKGKLSEHFSTGGGCGTADSREALKQGPRDPPLSLSVLFHRFCPSCQCWAISRGQGHPPRLRSPGDTFRVFTRDHITEYEEILPHTVKRTATAHRKAVQKNLASLQGLRWQLQVTAHQPRQVSLGGAEDSGLGAGFLSRDGLWCSPLQSPVSSPGT